MFGALPPFTPTTDDLVVEPKPDVVPVVRDEGRSVLLIDLGARSVHTVNVSAGLIWGQCDGVLDVAGVTAAVAATFQVNPSDIAADVHASITDFRQRGLLRADDDAPFDPSGGRLRPGPEGTSYVIAEPCDCGIDLDTLPWAGTLTVAIGSVRVGVRFNSTSAGVRLRERFGPRVLDDPDAPVTYTVVLLDGTSPPDGPIRRSGLYEGRRWQPGSADHDDILTRLASRIEAWAPIEAGQVRLHAVGLEGPQGVVLVPAQQGFDQRLQERATVDGWRFLDPPIGVDSERRTVDGRPVTGVVWPGGDTTRLEPDDVLRRLVSTADAHPGDDLESLVDSLERLAESLTAVETPAAQLLDIAAALIRPRA